jgi:hypothetical protein
LQFDRSNNFSQILGKTKELGSFVNAVPLLREKKRIIDVHTNIAHALLNEIKDRELDTYFQLEEDMIAKIPQVILSLFCI